MLPLPLYQQLQDKSLKYQTVFIFRKTESYGPLRKSRRRNKSTMTLSTKSIDVYQDVYDTGRSFLISRMISDHLSRGDLRKNCFHINLPPTLKGG